MIRLRFPRVSPSGRHAAASLPAELRWDAPAAGPTILLTRRQFLKAAGIALAALATPVTRARRLYARSRGTFFTSREFQTLKALCDRIIPPDGDPGAVTLGAPHYIGRMLCTLERRRPRIFAGGPFSNRNPFPDNDVGAPSSRHPRNDFRRVLPLTRLQEMAWRAELYGSTAVPEMAALDAQFGGPKKGLRDVYREGLAKVDQVALATKGDRFKDLPVSSQNAVMRMLDAGAFAPDARRGNKTFMDLLIQHTLEGCFAPPEYGGNRTRAGRPQGWQMLGLEGDNQPLGFSIFSRQLDGYVERPDHPMSTPNPDELGPGGTIVPRPLTADGQDIQDNIVLLSSILGDAC